MRKSAHTVESALRPGSAQAILRPQAGSQDKDDVGDYPIVSMLMAVHNTGRFLRQAIESALSETYPNFELLVFDDVSTDESPAIIAQYARDPRVRVFRTGKKAATVAEIDRFLVAQSRGEYFISTDSDDVFLPHRVQRLVAAALASPSASCVFGKCRKISEDGIQTPEFQGEPVSPFTLLLRNPVGNSAALVSRRHYALTSGYNNRRTWAEDYELRLKLFEQGPLIFVDEVTFLHRNHPNSMTRTRCSVAEEVQIKQAAAERNEGIVSRLVARKNDPIGHRESVAVQYVAAYLAKYRRRPHTAYRLLRLLKAQPLPARLALQIFFYQMTRSHRKRSCRILATYVRNARPGPRAC